MKKISIGFMAVLALAAFTGCGKKKGGGDINAVCEDVYNKEAKDGDKYTAGKGDKKAYMDYCTKQKPEFVACASIDKAFDDDDCKKLTGVMAEDKTGFEVKRKVMELRAGVNSGTPPAGGSGDGAMNGGDNQPATGGAGDLPAECKDYQAAIESLAKCEKLPQATRDALKQSYEQTSAAWASVPAEGRAALGTACKSAADAVKQSAAACN
ncbi:MAG: hypothetical protein H0T46_09455 [Deltaproteobacteria bacterium]|nr:hypothetical protein [Deltaproteobacteria bacterium]